MRVFVRFVLLLVAMFVVLGTTSAFSLEDEATMTAYVKLDQPIDLQKARNAFKSISHETDTYIWGILNVGAIREETRPWAYVSSDGWIFVYLPKDFGYGRIGLVHADVYEVKSWNNLEVGVKKVCDALGYSDIFSSEIQPNIKYYDFEYPQANELYIFSERVAGGTNIFKVYPTTTNYRVEWYAWGYYPEVKIDGVAQPNLGEAQALTANEWHTFSLHSGGRARIIVIFEYFS